MIHGVPFSVRAADGGVARAERPPEEAAADPDAAAVRVFSTIARPLAPPGPAAGAPLAWTRAPDEFGATIPGATTPSMGSLAGPTRTMPLAICGECGGATSTWPWSWVRSCSARRS